MMCSIKFFFFFFFLSLETGFLCVALPVLDFADQAGLKLRDSPASASQSAGITGVYNHTQLSMNSFSTAEHLFDTLKP